MPNPRPSSRQRGSSPEKPGQRVLAALRRMIASGVFADGERIAEIPTAERLGVSRMPVRTALRALALEGLVAPLGSRGFAARPPSRASLHGAIEVRGVLEGLAARLAAQHADHGDIAGRLSAVIAPCDGLFATPAAPDVVLAHFSAANSAFHGALVAACDNGAVALALAQTNRLPLAAPDAFAFGPDDAAPMLKLLERAHDEHRAIVAAIAAGEADRAETLMRQHARVSLALEQGL